MGKMCSKIQVRTRYKCFFLKLDVNASQCMNKQSKVMRSASLFFSKTFEIKGGVKNQFKIYLKNNFVKYKEVMYMIYLVSLLIQEIQFYMQFITLQDMIFKFQLS